MVEANRGSRRRTFGPALLMGLVAAGSTAVAGNQAWVQPASGAATGSIAQVAAIAADASAPLTTAVALVVLACWGVLLVTRGGVRRVMAVLAAAASLGLLVAVVLSWIAAPGELQDLMAGYGVTDAAVRRTGWAWWALVAAPVALAATLIAVRDVGHWPQMGSRYDAPKSGAPASTNGIPAEEQSSLELWKALDDGTDPTDQDPVQGDPDANP